MMQGSAAASRPAQSAADDATRARGRSRAATFVCPDGRPHLFVCEVSDDDPAGASADFLLHGARMVVAQGMSLPLAMLTLNFALRHYYGAAQSIATAFLGAVEGRSLRYAIAGHVDVFLASGTRAERLPGTGPDFGLFPNAAWPESVIGVERGEALIVATSELVDAAAGDAHARDAAIMRIAAACSAGTGGLSAGALLGELRERTEKRGESGAVALAAW